MNALYFLVAGIFAFASVDGSAAQGFPLYDYGTEYAYGTNFTGILDALKNEAFYKFRPADFVPGTYDIFNGPVVVLYRPEDQVFLRAYYYPNGLSQIFTYGQDDHQIFYKYAPLHKYFLKELFSKYANAFTPKAAEVAAPELFFYDLKEFIYGEVPKEGNIPVVYFAPQHERPTEFYQQHGFNKIAQFGVLSPFFNPFAPTNVNSPFSTDYFPVAAQTTHSSSTIFPLVYYTYSNVPVVKEQVTG